MNLIILTGPPSSGKSTLARGLASNLGYAILSKDKIKERIMDVVGAPDRQASRAHGLAAFKILRDLTEEFLTAGVNLVLDANYVKGELAQEMDALASSHGARVLHLRLTAPDADLLERFRSRSASGDRHVGHFDADHEGELQKLLAAGPYPHPDFRGVMLDLNTADAHPFGKALSWVEKQLEGA